MKKLVLAALLFSSPSLADNHFYAGAGLSLFNNTSLEVSGLSVDESADPGVNLLAGYSVAVSSGLELGIELEYQHLGKTSFGQNLSVESNAYYVNLRPKFVEAGNPLYSALIFGVGSMNSELTLLGKKMDDSEISYQAGFEIGYMINEWDLGIGYRYNTADFDGLDIANHGVTLGFRYNF